MNNQRKVILFAIIIFAIAVLVAFVLNLSYKIVGPMALNSEWGAGDALNYVAVIFGAFGTIILGYVAYMQNERLQKIESDNYIANFGSMFLIKSVTIEETNCIPTSWDKHPEQIILDSCVKADGLQSFLLAEGLKMTFQASWIGGAVPVAIHIEDCDFYVKEKDEGATKKILFGSNYDEVTYSNIAISNDRRLGFETTYIIGNANSAFKKAFQNVGNNLVVDLKLSIITDKKVRTYCKCRADCRGSSSAGKTSWETKNPTVFYYGSDVVENIKWKSSSKKVVAP